MLTLKRLKKEGNWYISGSLYGQRYRESTGTSSRAHAEAILARRQKEILDAVALGQENTTTFAEAAEMYMLSGGEARFLPPLIKAFGHLRLIDITQRDISEYVGKLSSGPAGINRQVFTPLIAVFNHAHKSRLGPAPAFQRPIVRRQKTLRYATDDDIKRLLPHCSDRLGAAVLTLTLTGARATEVCNLTEDDVDWEAGVITFVLTKNGEARSVSASETLMRALRHLRGRPGPLFGFTSRFSLNQAIARACDRAGMETLTSHEIGRHSFAARLLRMGYTLAEVAKAGGWKSYRVVAETYGHLERSRVDDAVREAGKFLATSTYTLRKVE